MKKIKLKQSPYEIFAAGSYTVEKHILLKIIFRCSAMNFDRDLGPLKEKKRRARRAYTVLLYRMKGYTLSELGKKLGVGKERIRQIEARTFRKITRAF